MTLENLTPSQVKEIIRSEFRQLPETHWIQNLRQPSYLPAPANPDLNRKSG